MTEMTWLDATAQADLVRRGEVSPKELAEAAIAAIEAMGSLSLDWRLVRGGQLPRWRLDWCRSRTPTTAAAPSASRRANAGWSGSSPPADG